MKRVNELIAMLVLFTPTGKIAPFLFKYKNKSYKVKKVLKFWHKNSYHQGLTFHYTIQVKPSIGEEKICEVLFSQNSKRWVLVKM